MPIITEDELFRSLEDIGWEIRGSLDTRLDLSRSTSYSLLQARVEIKKSAVYRTSAKLSAPEETIVRISYTSPTKRNALEDLGRRVISLFEAYITGSTNERHRLEAYEKYKV